MRTMHTVTDITKTTLRLLVGTGCAMVLAGVVSGCGFTELAKLEASDGFGNNFYGESVSISNDWILVGAPADSSNTAATYLYHFDGSVWTQYKKFSSPGNLGDKFGQSVSISNGVAVIGAPDDSSMGPGAGTAYVYRRHPAPFGGWFWLGDG